MHRTETVILGSIGIWTNKTRIVPSDYDKDQDVNQTDRAQFILLTLFELNRS